MVDRHIAGRGLPAALRRSPSRTAQFGQTVAAGLLVVGSVLGVGLLTVADSASVAVLPVDRSPLGATGALPVLHVPAGDFLDARVPPPPTGFVAEDGGAVAGPAALTASTALAAAATDDGIPDRVLSAYRQAEATTARTLPGCHLRWEVLAGIGRIEASHAEGGRLTAAGVASPAILGPVLNGQPGTAAVADSDGGRLDGEPVWDRAVGPMQFLPSTWQVYGGGGDPQNVDDAAVATGRYLCAGATDLADPAQLFRAVYRYNHSAAYVTDVLGWARAYQAGFTAVPNGLLVAPAQAASVGPTVPVPPVLLLTAAQRTDQAALNPLSTAVPDPSRAARPAAPETDPAPTTSPPAPSTNSTSSDPTPTPPGTPAPTETPTVTRTPAPTSLPPTPTSPAPTSPPAAVVAPDPPTASVALSPAGCVPTDARGAGTPSPTTASPAGELPAVMPTAPVVMSPGPLPTGSDVLACRAESSAPSS